MHLLNKRRPKRPQGCAARAHVPTAGRLGEAAARARQRLRDAATARARAPSAPAAGRHCHMPVTQTPGEKEQPPRVGGWQNPGWSPAHSARALACRHRGRARTHKAAALFFFLAWPASLSLVFPPLPAAGTGRLREIDGSSQ